MSVYTLPALNDVQLLVQSCGLPPVCVMEPIKGGIENSNFFLSLEDGRVIVLTIFEELNRAEAVFLGPLLAKLSAEALPVAEPFQNAQGEWLHTLAAKPAQLAPRLVGAHPLQPSAEACHEMGAALARLHLALKNYPLQRPHAHGEAWWLAVANRWRALSNDADKALLETVLEKYRTCLPEMLPKGLIHGDLFRDNVLFAEEKISGILDFSECGEGYWLLDIAITTNDFCRAWPLHTPDPIRLQAFLAGYSTQRLLEPAEQQAMPLFQALAAMRFWLSRLEVQARNQAEQRSGETILEKDPREMRDLLAHYVQML